MHEDIKIENSVVFGNTYWVNRGLHQDKLNILTANNALGNWSRRYYRFYNDGDIPRGITGIKSWKSETCNAKELEFWADKMILKDWERYQRK